MSTSHNHPRAREDPRLGCKDCLGCVRQSLTRARLTAAGSPGLPDRTVSLQASLEQLLQVLHGTTPHYIRCIKPNSQGQAHTFLQEEVSHGAEAALQRALSGQGPEGMKGRTYPPSGVTRARLPG